ncbi:2-hydroxyacid dehydrogenase [Methylobacterium sp. J-068]|uniref:2-hydroxyacid dehydrogenase n=1 Tax=Methylobacterium sp. J-068 TaxID=2836649 RepID=UPI001FBBFA8F|nr:glyoxylate/hydroxypyruvate reductase A [Methylobacterium sp. J-068]MCJ2033878.1 glyoxylate/hydroxypyruvate reductase A [Methylobacterium sp. J-068]
MPAPLVLVTSLEPAEDVAWRDALARAMPEEAIATSADPEALARAEIAIVANPPPGVLARMPRLLWVHSLWAGVDRLLLDGTLPPVPVVRLVDPALARAMAEAVAAAALHLHRDLHLYADQQRRSDWRPHDTRPAHARTVTLLGLGEMGRAAALLLRAIGFTVQGWSRTGGAVDGIRVFSGADGLARALAGTDILVNLLPLTPETRGLLNRDAFARLPRGAGVVNFGRGAHLAEDDLIEALDAGALGHAILDVFETEPLPPGHRLWSHPGITILPHIAAPTSRASAAGIVAEAVRSFRGTGRIPTGVDRGRGY